MPEGSSSAAPVMIPGPSDFSSDRIQRNGTVFDTKELDARSLRIKSKSKQNDESHRLQVMPNQNLPRRQGRNAPEYNRALPQGLPPASHAVPVVSQPRDWIREPRLWPDPKHPQPCP